MQQSFFIGLDLGLRRDPTAVAIIEKLFIPPAPPAWTSDPAPALMLRAISRFPLETPYSEMPDRLSKIISRLPAKVPKSLAVDATGVGAPVIEMLRRSFLPVTLLPVILTGGSNAHRLPHALSVPRRALLENLRSLLENHTLRIPTALPLLSDLKKELMAIGKPNTSVDEHDDLAFALALAAWPARPLPSVGPQARRLL